MIGRIHSFQSLGTVDGPGVRFVAFLQGCPLRCGCCHNPDTWDVNGGKPYTPRQLVDMASRYRTYFGAEGGVTLSGGEPLLQAGFAAEVFRLCRQADIHTCLDTSGCVWNEETEALLAVTDRVLLDVKYTNEADYRAYVGCELSTVLSFLAELDKRHIPTTLRQVIIPERNDNVENAHILKEVCNNHSCVDKVELLPFRKLCQVKYDQMGIAFPFGHLAEPTAVAMAALNACLLEK